MKMGTRDRCDHCGKFVTTQHMELYTLFEMANGHYHEEDCAICWKCSMAKKYTAEYWFKWLDEKYGKRP